MNNGKNNLNSFTQRNDLYGWCAMGIWRNILGEKEMSAEYLYSEYLAVAKEPSVLMRKNNMRKLAISIAQEITMSR